VEDESKGMGRERKENRDDGKGIEAMGEGLFHASRGQMSLSRFLRSEFRQSRFLWCMADVIKMFAACEIRVPSITRSFKHDRRRLLFTP
jgi:hypothetical protein